jgi:hypothetical protein
MNIAMNNAENVADIPRVGVEKFMLFMFIIAQNMT